MPITTQKITPCLWFDTQAEQAANAYVAIFKNSKIVRISRYGKEDHQYSRQRGGMGHDPWSSRLMGEDLWRSTAARSSSSTRLFLFQVHCATQKEVDYFCNKLAEEGEESRCGWVKDKYGLS